MAKGINEMDLNEPTMITSEAFSGKSVLITGTTGFVGKVVLEKLLRTVPSVQTIYLLIRGNSRFPSAQDRFMNEVYTSSIFDQLKEDQETSFQQLCDEKIRFVGGELTQPHFGLKESEFSALADKIDVVINSAASVNFREPLHDALQTNTLCLYTLIELAQRRRIPVVHVSTCYVNGFNKGVIAENVGGPQNNLLPKTGTGPLDPYQVEELITRLSELAAEVSDAFSHEKERNAALIELGLQQAALYGWNDTYTFTKWLGEQILLQHLKKQSLTIVRPSIVESTLSSPAPGWIEGVKVADAIIMAYAREKVSFFPGDRRGIIDIIPADLVANSIIMATAESLSAEPQHRIYQCSSSYSNPVTIREIIEHVMHEGRNHHHKHRNLFLRRPRKPFMMVPGWIFNIGIQGAYRALGVNQWIQALLGKSPSTFKLSKLDTAMKLALVFSFYTRPKYQFKNTELCSLYNRMNESDKALFPMDAQLINWEHYIRNIHISGLNQYALKPRAPSSRRLKSTTQPAVA